jgi:hypothetical protein
MVRESRLLWDNPSLRPDDTDRLRRLERGDEERCSPLPPRSKRPKNKHSHQSRRRDPDEPQNDL